MIGSMMREKHPGYGISAHWSALEKVIGCFDQFRYFGSVTWSSYVVIDMICRAVSFCSRLVSKAALPPKMEETVLVVS